MMIDYIKFPTVITDIKQVHSTNIIHLAEKSTVIDQKISLNYLRDLYKTDRDAFVKVVDELALRGFQFFIQKPTNILPNFQVDISPCLVVEDDYLRYKEVNFSKLGMAGFLQRFHVESDRFFHKIPLRGFSYLNGNLDIDEVMDEFTKAGFLFGSQEDVLNTTEDEGQVHIHVSSISEKGVDGPIDALFQESKYNSFRRFCNRKGIESVQEITAELIEQFRLTPQVGEVKVQDVLERLEELKHCKADTPESNPEENFVQIDNKYARQKDIFLLVHENKYTMFRDFCKEEGISTIGQVKNKHIAAFSNRPRVGKKKVQDVITVLQNYADTVEESVPTSFRSGGLFQHIQCMLVTDLLVSYGKEPIAASEKTIADIEGKNIEELEQEFEGEVLIELANLLVNQKHPKDMVNQLKGVLSERELKILQLRFSDKLTLEATAQVFDVTRERIRQVEIKALQKLFQHLEMNNFLFVIKLFSSSKTLITGTELVECLGEENSYLFEILKHKDSFFMYAEKLDAYFYDVEDFGELIHIDGFMDDLPETFYLYEIETTLEDLLERAGISRPTVEVTRSLLQSYGFYLYNDLISRYKFTISHVLRFLFQHYITDPFKMDDEGLETLQMLALRHFNYKLEGSVRSVDARLRDIDNILLVDSNTYQWFDSENFNQSIITKIDEYLKMQFLEKSSINIEEVFQAFIDELEEMSITHKLHLYSIVRYYLDEEYSIGKGNTLQIFQNESDKLDKEGMLIHEIHKLGGSCTKSELQEILCWPSYRIDLTISTSNKIVSWGTNQVILYDKIGLTKEEELSLLSLIDRSLQNGYLTTGSLYNELMFDRSLATLISDKGIDSKVKLASIIKVLKPNLKGHTNFMYEEGSSITTFEEVALQRFDRETTRKELQEFAREHGYEVAMGANLVVRVLDQEKSFIEIDYDQLYPTHLLNLPDDVIEDVKTFVEEQMDGKEYISLSNLTGYKRKLPLIDFRWNPYLIKSILIQHGYRQINKVYRDYRYDKVIVVKDESSIQTFEELVHHILKNDYDGNMHEVKVYEFLMKKGILREQEYDHNKVLPHEIKGYDNLVNVDSIGIVTIR